MKSSKTKENLNTKGRPKMPAPPKAGISKSSERRFGCGGNIKKCGGKI